MVKQPEHETALSAINAALTAEIAARRQAEAELRKSHEMLSRLAEQMPGVVYQYRLFPDGRSCFPFSSSGMMDIYGVTPEEVREDATSVFGRLHPDDYDFIATGIQESARTLNLYHSEFRVILPGQGVRWRLCDAKPERMEDGGTLWYGVISDITARKQAEADRDKLQAQLRQAHKMESVGRLAGGVAHDFNNMLSVIMGHSEIALSLVEESHPICADLLEIREAAERSANLTRQLLAFARKQTIAPKVLDVNETVEGMLKMLRRLIGEDIELTWRPGANLAPIKMDPNQIDQVLANLCVNARDAISGVGTVTIESGNAVLDQKFVTAHIGSVAGQYVRLAVRDNGCGMDQETLSHLFEPFFTTKDVGEGTGLGLATVYGVVKQNLGFIDVESEPGRGTAVTIYLPRHVGERSRPEENDSPETTTAGHETILLVEDEPAVLRLSTKMLETLGYRVMAAAAPSEAVRLAEKHGGEIHLLMTDVVMPEMNGRDLAKLLVSMYPSIKRLFTSGYTADVIAHHGVLDEGLHFIQKPFSLKDLAAKVRAVLDQD